MTDVATAPMMTAPDVCLYCGHLLARDGAGIRHRAPTPCREPRPCEPREREMRWQEWVTEPQWARAPGRGGAPHILRYGTPGLALCGAQVGAPLRHSRAHGCVACRNAWCNLGYAWQCERHWRTPYGGSAIDGLAEALGLRPRVALLAELTHEAIEAGSYGEPSPPTREA